jgi:hypothetical protein
MNKVYQKQFPAVKKAFGYLVKFPAEIYSV